MEWAYDAECVADHDIGAIWCVVDRRSKPLGDIQRLQRELQANWAEMYPDRRQPTILIGWSGRQREL